MKNKITIILHALFALGSTACFSQDVMKEKTFNTMSFFYVDNCSGYELASLNNDLKETLKEKIAEQSGLSDNYFYFWGCNGSNPKEIYSATVIKDQEVFTKFLSHESNDADFENDKLGMREHFINYPVKIKQTLEINFFLSSKAIGRLFDDVSLLPTPLVFPQELVLYLNASPGMKVKWNIYINKESTEKFSEEKIRSCFDFYFKQRNLESNLIFI